MYKKKFRIFGPEVFLVRASDSVSFYAAGQIPI